MLIVFCFERPGEECAPFGWGIELCGSSSFSSVHQTRLKKELVSSENIPGNNF